jgi:serine/threonine protein kinase
MARRSWLACQDLLVALLNLASNDPLRVGPYVLQGRLGAGGMGVVYLGFVEGGDPVAVKTLPRGVAADLRREAELLARVRHPRVARFVDAGIDDDRPWLAMQYVAGPSLADAATPLAAAPLRQLVDGLAEALAALHQVGLTHRDVKPGNVILTFDGPVLVDLGIAVSPEVTSFTATGTVVGSPAWMGPEQLAGEPVGAPADVWGWAAVAHDAATGRPPFGDGPLPALAYRIQHANVRVDGLPGWLRDKVVSGLAKDPDSSAHRGQPDRWGGRPDWPAGPIDDDGS